MLIFLIKLENKWKTWKIQQLLRSYRLAPTHYRQMIATMGLIWWNFLCTQFTPPCTRGLEQPWQFLKRFADNCQLWELETYWEGMLFTIGKLLKQFWMFGKQVNIGHKFFWTSYFMMHLQSIHSFCYGKKKQDLVTGPTYHHCTYCDGLTTWWTSLCNRNKLWAGVWWLLPCSFYPLVN